MSKKDAPKKLDATALDTVEETKPAVAEQPSAFARVVNAIAEVVRPAADVVEFDDHTGSARRGKVNSGGYVELRANYQLDGVQIGERFGERPALAFRLVAEGKATLIDESAFTEEAITNVREDGGDEASTNLATT